MISVNYHKRKTTEVLKNLEDSKYLSISNPQNYIPIYSRFFSLNETNYNNIHLNHKWHISSINNKDETNEQLYNCKLTKITNNKVKNKNVFFKIAPLLDPYKYLIGKYNINDEHLFDLPKINYDTTICHSKLLNENNSAYVDGFFLFLTSKLIDNHKFIHGVDYYGSYLGIKNNFVINAYDDIEYLSNSDFFIKNQNILFEIDNDELFKNENKKKSPIKIEYNTSAKSELSIKSLKNELFEDLFQDNSNENNENNENIINLEDITDINLLENKHINSLTLKTNSSCSSRTSYTHDSSQEDTDEDISYEEDSSEEGSNEDISDEENSDEEERIDLTIKKFPVQIIGMEYCENTFDNLILKNNLSNDEWFSALMQIIMILITYQKAFNFTHNDLHTNNVMYNVTDKKYIYYCYKNKYYKVPTFGRLFKIIDFGRSIYKFDNKLFCSDSFQMGGDAATQYNIEPYFNNKKPLLEPNFSFDLCRLACSIFDYLIDDFEETKKSNINDPVKRLIINWCLDDKETNILYKNDGSDRYPDFKLYKMIARCVHKHTPQAQLERKEFKSFITSSMNVLLQEVINIDNIPSYI
jgi:hypothetical protein